MISIRWSLAIGIFLMATRSWPVPSGDRASDEFGVKSADVLAMMQKVADWQLAHPGPDPPLRWTQAALYTGMMALGDLSANPGLTPGAFLWPPLRGSYSRLDEFRARN